MSAARGPEVDHGPAMSISAGLPWIDWDTAATVAVSAVPVGPRATLEERRDVVTELRACAERAPRLVAEVSGLPVAPAGRVQVIDRAGFARADAEMVREVWSRAGVEPHPEGPGAIAGIVRGGAVGKMIGMLSGHVLGQFSPLGVVPSLFLVAPSILATERRLGVDSSDFRLWVALHEQTHRAQFGAAGWLAEWLVAQVHELAADDEADVSAVRSALDHLAMLKHPAISGAAGNDASGEAAAPDGSGPNTEQVLDRVSGVMSLLEGHADVMMDRAGTAVVPSLPVIRARFDAKRGKGGPQMVILRAMGIDAKLAQYREGAAFCRAVIDSQPQPQAGVALLNRCFEGPGTMPSLVEIRQPQQWLARVKPAGPSHPAGKRQS